MGVDTIVRLSRAGVCVLVLMGAIWPVSVWSAEPIEHFTRLPAIDEVHTSPSGNRRALLIYRIAHLRKARNLIQAQLAEVLGVAQQTVQGYEAGSRRILVSTLQVVADTLAVSLDELFGSQAKAARASGSKRGPVPQRQQHIEAISRLPRSRQQFVSDILRNVLGQAEAR